MSRARAAQRRPARAATPTAPTSRRALAAAAPSPIRVLGAARSTVASRIVWSIDGVQVALGVRVDLEQAVVGRRATQRSSARSPSSTGSSPVDERGDLAGGDPGEQPALASSSAPASSASAATSERQQRRRRQRRGRAPRARQRSRTARPRRRRTPRGCRARPRRSARRASARAPRRTRLDSIAAGRRRCRRLSSSDRDGRRRAPAAPR